MKKLSNCDPHTSNTVEYLLTDHNCNTKIALQGREQLSLMFHYNITL